MVEIRFEGCNPTPLASYLKALALMRIVAEQADEEIKGCWKDEAFVIHSSLGVDELMEFLAERYVPTPIVAPWNGGSGFFPGDATDGMDAIMGCADLRFKPYQEVIKSIRAWPEMPRKIKTVSDLCTILESFVREMKQGKKRDEAESLVNEIMQCQEEAGKMLGKEANSEMELDSLESAVKNLKGEKKRSASALWKVIKNARTQCKTMERKNSKEQLFAACRSRLPDKCLSWLDATVALCADGSPAYNPLLGTGGNELRLDFSNNFMQRLADLFINGDMDRTEDLMRASVLGKTLPGMVKGKIGQFDPGRAGGFNQGTEVETKNSKINPWDFILMLEGACVLSSAVARRNQAEVRGHAAIPFTVRFSGVGFSSDGHGEDGKYETWLPIWRQPIDFHELCYMFSEGRSTIGRRPVRDGLEFTRAVGLLGVDRGVDEFVRFAFVERRGKSYVALPAGRIRVRFLPELRLLDDLDPILSRLDYFLGKFKKHLPATFRSARRRIDEAIYACCENPEPTHFLSLVRALGRMELLIAQRDRAKKPALGSPLHGLKPAWIAQCDDGGPEVRIAAALASIRSTGKVGSIRSNIAGVDAAKPFQWAVGSGQKSWHGNSLVERLGRVLARRMMDAERTSTPGVPVDGWLRISPHDVVPFLYGETDDQMLEDLLWGFSLIDWRKKGAGKLREQWHRPLMRRPLPRNWCLLKLLYSPGRIRRVEISREPRIISLLTAGRVQEATQVALRRLLISGLRPLSVQYEEWIEPDRLLAGLLVPTGEQWRLESLVLEKNEPQG